MIRFQASLLREIRDRLLSRERLNGHGLGSLSVAAPVFRRQVFEGKPASQKNAKPMTCEVSAVQHPKKVEQHVFAGEHDLFKSVEDEEDGAMHGRLPDRPLKL